MNNIVFGKKQVGDGNPTFITFEAGPTHDGLESAKRLIRYAAEAGGDAVKFQIFDPEELVADKEMPYSYEVLVDKVSGRKETVTESLYGLLKRRCLKADEWRELKRYSDELGLTFFATLADEWSLKLAEELHFDSIKVASADINYWPWLRKIARLGVSIQLDTGSATFGEIENAIDVIREEGNEKIIIHNCPSGYPAHIESINLRTIPNLKRLFGCPVAYSDHTPGENMDIAAVALGANLVEKTITENRLTRSVEHIMSLEPDDMKKFVSSIRELEVALGGSRRVMSVEEKKKRLNVRRSVYLDQDVKAGQKLGDVKVKFQRPGYGIPPDLYETLLESKINKDLNVGECLSLKDLS